MRKTSHKSYMQIGSKGRCTGILFFLLYRYHQEKIMKKYLLATLLLVAFLPLRAWNVTALERALYSVPDGRSAFLQYHGTLAATTRQAIRLGYTHFHDRVNTPQMTSVDEEIAICIEKQLQPFFTRMDKLSHSNTLTPEQYQLQFTQQFSEIVAKLAVLFYQNQTRYPIRLFVDEQAAVDETILIVREALARGKF